MTGVLKRNEDVIWREIDGKIVIIDKDGLATYTLNKTSACIWQSCDGTKGQEEITMDLCAKFDVKPGKAEADVSETIRKFEEMGLLRKE